MATIFLLAFFMLFADKSATAHDSCNFVNSNVGDLNYSKLLGQWTLVYIDSDNSGLVRAFQCPEVTFTNTSDKGAVISSEIEHKGGDKMLAQANVKPSSGGKGTTIVTTFGNIAVNYNIMATDCQRYAIGEACFSGNVCMRSIGFRNERPDADDIKAANDGFDDINDSFMNYEMWCS